MRIDEGQMDWIMSILREALETASGGMFSPCQNQECLDMRADIEGTAIVVAKALERLAGIDYSDATTAAEAARASAEDASLAIDCIETEVDEVSTELQNIEAVFDRILRS